MNGYLNPAKELGKVVCLSCMATAPNDSKHRGRFRRRHDRDNVCGNYIRRGIEEKERLANDLKARVEFSAQLAEGTKYVEEVDGGKRVDMSGGPAATN